MRERLDRLRIKAIRHDDDVASATTRQQEAIRRRGRKLERGREDGEERVTDWTREDEVHSLRWKTPDMPLCHR